MDAVMESLYELVGILEASGWLWPLVVMIVASAVVGVIKQGIRFLLVLAVVLFVATSLGILVV